MLKLSAMSLALVVALVSPALAKKTGIAPPTRELTKQCFTPEGFLANTPEHVHLLTRLDADKTAAFIKNSAGNMDPSSQPIFPSADEVLLFSLPNGNYLFIGFAKGCGIGSGIIPAGMLKKLLPDVDDGTI